MTRKAQCARTGLGGADGNVLPIPPDSALDIPAFARSFRAFNTSHKFLWASALLQVLEDDEFEPREIPFQRLAAGMLDAARRPVHLFRLRLGRDDKTGLWLQQLEESPHWNRREISRLRGRVFSVRPNDIPASIVEGLTGYAPFLFLSPFFERETHGMTGSPKFRKIEKLAAERFGECSPPPYCFPRPGFITVHPAWAEYIARNLDIIRPWVLWHWARHLQNKNANVPAIVDKLDENSAPNTVKQRNFWRRVMESRRAGLSCIYTGESVAPDNFALDHYVPWSFVAHDNMWNLAPVSVLGNSEKSDNLPNNKHFPNFVELQHAAICAFHEFPKREKGRWEGILEPYSADLNLDVVSDIPNKEVLCEALTGAINPLLSLAQSRDFPSGWEFSKKSGNAIL